MKLDAAVGDRTGGWEPVTRLGAAQQLRQLRAGHHGMLRLGQGYGIGRIAVKMYTRRLGDPLHGWRWTGSCYVLARVWDRPARLIVTR